MKLEETLTTYPWPRPDLDVPEPPYQPLRLAVQSNAEEGDVRMDQPYGAAYSQYSHRQYMPRRVITFFKTPGREIPIRMS